MHGTSFSARRRAAISGVPSTNGTTTCAISAPISSAAPKHAAT